MSRRGKLSAGAYARAVERAWSARVDRPVVLSAKDWSLVSDWHARGIPLELVREALERSGERGRRRPSATAGPRALSGIAPAIEEAWRTVIEGRLSRDPGIEPPAAVVPPARRWEECRDRPETPAGLRRALDALLQRLADGEDPAELDRCLDEALPAQAPDPLLAAVSDEVEGKLAPYRDRISPELLQQTRRRAIKKGLRSRLGLVPLAQQGSAADPV